MKYIQNNNRYMLGKRRAQSGFTLMELMVVLIVVIILAAIVILLMGGFFSSARESVLDTDIKSIKSAVDAYMIQAYMSQGKKVPTMDGNLPLSGELAPIDFEASFIEGGKVKSFYPHILAELPRHADEGVWKLDSGARVVFDMERDKY